MRVLVALLVMFIGLWGMTAPPPVAANHELLNEGVVIVEANISGSWLALLPDDGLTVTVTAVTATGPATLFVDISGAPALNSQRAAPDVLVATSGDKFLATATYTYGGTAPVAVRSDASGATPYLRRAWVIDWPSPVLNSALTGTRRLLAPPLRV